MGLSSTARNPVVDQIASTCASRERIQIMEVCGTHTVSIFRHGIRSLLPQNLRLVSGPGCPVCVTAQRHIDAALELANQQDVIIAIDGNENIDQKTFREALNKKEPGDKVKLKIRRDGKERDLTVELQKFDSEKLGKGSDPMGAFQIQGMENWPPDLSLAATE